MKEIMNFVNECNESLEKLMLGIVLVVFGLIVTICFAAFGWSSAVLGAISYLLIIRSVGSLYGKGNANKANEVEN